MTRPPSRQKRNEGGDHRPAPSFPPIDPRLVYPWRRLRDWGFGARGIASLVKAGLAPMKFGKLRFFAGLALIGVLERHQGDGQQPDSISGGDSSDSQQNHGGNGRTAGSRGRKCCETP